MLPTAVGFLLLSILITWALTTLLQNHAEHRGVLAVPNHRSSHSEPTPTGGGWAFVLVGLSSSIAIVFYFQLALAILWFVIVPVAVISVIGGYDDLHPLSPKLRLFLQVICSALVLLGLYKANVRLVESWPWPLLLICGLFACAFLVWFINLYNFMDGIDGIATLKAITIVLSWVVIWLSSRQAMSLPELLAMAIFAGSMTGFLIRNWSPAGIFMGDVGSGYIGFSLAIVFLYLVMVQPHLLIAWFIPCSVFCVDATFTLLRRMASGQNYLQAHRSHTYQILSRKWQSHSKVVLAMGLYNIFWLLPLAVIASLGPAVSLAALLAAWIPLLLLARHHGAGMVND